MNAMEQTRTSRLWPLAAFLDLLVLVSFVAFGHASHDLTGGVSWYAVVLLPFLVGWFGLALAVRLYGPLSMLSMQRWAVTWLVGVAAALAIRVLITHRAIPVPFDIVAAAYIGGLTVLWRLVWKGVRILGSQSGAPASARQSGAGGEGQ